MGASASLARMQAHRAPSTTPTQRSECLPHGDGLSLSFEGAYAGWGNLVGHALSGLYGPGGTAELLNPPVPPKRLYPPSRLDDAAYPTEAKELAERAAAFRFSQPRGPGGCFFFDAGGPVVGLATEPHVDDALRARRSDMLRRERGR